MKLLDKLPDKNVTLLVGSETLELYFKEISRHLETMIGQAAILETAIIEMKEQMHERTATEQPVAHSNI